MTLPGRLARRSPFDVRRPADSPCGPEGDRRRRLRVADGHPGGDHSGADGGFRRGGPGADRHRQDGGVRDPDPVQDRRHQQSNPGAGAGADPRTGPAGRRGVQPLRRAPATAQRAADLRRRVVHRAAGRPQARRAGRGRHPGPGHRPPGTRHAGPVARGLPGARRGRRDADHGLRRRGRPHPVRNPGIQTGGAVFGDHAAGDPQDHHQVPARPAGSHDQIENHHRGKHFAALHPGRRAAQDGRADPRAGGRAVRGDDRLRPHQASHRRGRRKAQGPRLFRGRHQRRHPAGCSASAPSPR